MPRPVPTTSASLLDFAGKRAADQLQQTSDVIAARRKQRRNEAAKEIPQAVGQACAETSEDVFFASRVVRNSTQIVPRRIAGQRAARPKAPSDLRLTAAWRGKARKIQEPENVDECIGGSGDQLDRAFEGYFASGATGEFQEKNVTGTAAVDALAEWASGKRTCCICIDLLRKEDRIWSCPRCTVPTHLACVQSWASRLINFVQSQNMTGSNPWSCPSCRNSFQRSAYPSDYFCFCGKERDPRPDPWTLPHSCGDHCEKKLTCGHSCKLLCHPGPCPPCPLAVEVLCRCGSARRMKRCGEPPFNCEKICGKRLECGMHRCSQECHSGDCGPCQTKVITACACGKKKKMLPCSEASGFRCENVCKLRKPCGVHECDLVCHAPGECLPCPVEKVCSCGQTAVKLSCRASNQPRVRCERTCGKALGCRKHKCVRRCHEGPCGPCGQSSWQTCRCGAVSKDAPCGPELLCDRKCNHDKSCTRHKCNRRCCDGKCPPCNVSCDRKLDCGVCRCSLVCGHGGFDSLGAELYNCPPCTKKNEVRCFCGDTAVMVPCGLPKKPPPCASECRIPPLCHHERRESHKCHSGPCPPCTYDCGIEHSCGHECAEKCHDGVVELDYVAASWAKRAAGQSLQLALKPLMPKKITIDQAKCPPCESMLKLVCLGQHTQAFVKCHEPHWFGCDDKCGNLLPCGNHRCSRECHSVRMRRSHVDFSQMLDEDEAENGEGTHDGFTLEETQCEATVAHVDNDKVTELPLAVPPPPQPEECGECLLRCIRPRPDGCRHRCSWPCHFEPCPPCYEDVRVNCHCGQSILTYACCEVLSWPEVWRANSDDNPFLRCNQPCHRKHGGCPHMCTAKCHFGECPPCSRHNVTARCKCGWLKQQFLCAEVWKNGVQLVLECTEKCNEAAKAKQPVQGEKANETLMPKQAEPELSQEHIWQRKREKRLQREAENEERRRRQEAQEQWKRARKICGRVTIGLIIFTCFVLFVYFLYQLRQEELRRQRHTR